MKHLFLLFTVFAFVAAAQAVDGISAPVSRTVTLEGDEAAFSMTVGATLDSTAQQVKEALQNAGLPNPTVVATGLAQATTEWFAGPVQILYSATVTLAAGSATDTAKSLEALRTNPPAPLQSLQYSVAVRPSQAAVDAMRQTVLPQLLNESRKLAESLAAATGIKVGATRAISDFGGIYAYVNTAAFIYDPLTSVLPSPLSSSTQYTYSLNVVFAAVP
jgi:parvulin-like peptidyl-prolyl isomerase